MRDYEKLVKALRENAEWADGNIWEVPIMLPDNLKRAADAIEELQKRVELEYQSGFADGQRAANRKKNKWISVDERLPEQDVSVIGAVYCTDLIISEDGESIAEAYARCQAEAAKHPRVELCFCGEDGWYGCDGYPMICAPSYWMPLPEPPEVNEND